MSKKTKIDWADSTWNPVTGCLRGCEYCYARKIADRFGGYPSDNELHVLKQAQYIQHRNDDGEWNPEYKCAYPFSFAPTFHRYKLDEPQRWKKPRNIFVCSMADLFGDWVPNEWMREVFEACEAAPQHRYLFLTKYPKRYNDIPDFLTPSEEFYLAGKPEPMMLFGVTAVNNAQMKTAWESSAEWVSIEPIHESIESDFIFDVSDPYGRDERARWKWVVVGAETGNRKSKIIPKKEWIDEIVEACKYCDTPVFMKSSLRELMGADFKQEYPWGDNEDD